MTVLARQDNRSAGTANRIAAKTVAKQHPFPSKSINIGCRVNVLQQTAIGTDRMWRVVVGKYKENVWSAVGGVTFRWKHEQ